MKLIQATANRKGNGLCWLVELYGIISCCLWQSKGNQTNGFWWVSVLFVHSVSGCWDGKLIVHLTAMLFHFTLPFVNFEDSLTEGNNCILFFCCNHWCFRAEDCHCCQPYHYLGMPQCWTVRSGQGWIKVIWASLHQTGHSFYSNCLYIFNFMAKACWKEKKQIWKDLLSPYLKFWKSMNMVLYMYKYYINVHCVLWW